MSITLERPVTLPSIRYSRARDPFFETLRKRVQDYFLENALTKYATPAMVGKSVFQISLWLLLYLLIMSNRFQGWSLIMLQVGFHFTMFLLSVGIAHDGSHNAYSSNTRLNKAMKWVFDFIGINSYIWDFNHVRSHHSAPNIPLYDSAIHSFKLFRFHPRAEHFPFHRHQHHYIFGIYALATLFKLFFLDFFSFLRQRIGFVKTEAHPWREIAWLLITKSIVIAYTLVLPLLLLDAPSWQIVLGFVLGHLVSGVALGIIFQVTHISDQSSWPEPDVEGVIDNTFARHIMETTADFCTQNPVVTWISGGLNIHVAHHLFPHVSQIHLPALARIVKETAREYDVPYREFHSVRTAVAAHLRALKELGKIKEG